MNTKVINIPTAYECILPFLFPTYSICDPCYANSNFITHRDITSKTEREQIDIEYSDCVFISHKIFDEMWDEATIAKYALEFSKVHFKNRRKSIPYDSKTFIEDILNGMFGITSETEDAKISELFKLIGSSQLIPAIMQLSTEIPMQKIISAILTYISKIDKDSPNVIYKRAYIRFGGKLERNKMQALTEYTYRKDTSDPELSQLKLIYDLFA